MQDEPSKSPSFQAGSELDPFKTNLIAAFCYPQFGAGSVIVGGNAKELLGCVGRVLIIVA